MPPKIVTRCWICTEKIPLGSATSYIGPATGKDAVHPLLDICPRCEKILEKRKENYKMGDDKFVDFAKYCPKCEYSGNIADDEPCDECLCYSTNKNSQKPVNYVERKKKK